MTKPLILIWLDNPGPYTDAISACGLDEQVEILVLDKDAEIPEAELARIEAVIAWNIPEPLLLDMPRLRWIQTLSVAVDSWLVRKDLNSDIVLTCARGVHNVQMPESIIGSLLYVTRRFDVLAENQKAHNWNRRPPEPLFGKTLAILGLGTVGQEVARKLSPFGMRIIGTKRVPKKLPHIDKVYSPDQVDEVLAQADFVLLQLPVTPDTENLIDRVRLQKMKPEAYLLNFGRGQAIVDEDLVEALNNKWIKGAVLDVFRQEPLPHDHIFWDTSGLKILPHIGGMHPQRDSIVAELFVSNLQAFIGGEALTGVVDFDKGY
ncbi:MAG: D-2-hydroxyacid dehydrogenase [Desulfobulbia bacterium]